MAKQNNPQLNATKDTITQIVDPDGNIVVEIGLHEYTVRHSDGSRTHRRISETITTVDGTIWNPSMIAKMPIGICRQCLRPSFFKRKTHGIVLMSKARLCHDCGVLCCPSHRKLGSDKKWRYLAHHRSSLRMLKRLARPIFFERRED